MLSCLELNMSFNVNMKFLKISLCKCDFCVHIFLCYIIPIIYDLLGMIYIYYIMIILLC